jgi:hypothetical protein
MKIRESSRLSQPDDAFTFLELITVLVVLTLVTFVLFPALAASHPNVQAARCLNNMRQLMAATVMFTHDNADFFPPNPDDGNTTPGGNWVGGQAGGWMPTIAAGGSAQAGDPASVTNSLLATYLGYDASVFQCPADPRMCPYNGTNSASTGKPIKVVRSVSLNGGVGLDPRLGPGKKVNGPWLDGNHSHIADTPYATFGKMSDFRTVRPSEIWTFVDDDPWTINDGCMSVIAALPDAADYCSAVHGNATPFSFADGRAEIHKWKSAIWVHNSFPSRASFDAAAATGLGHDDWLWWASNATRNVNTGHVP